MNFKGLKFLTVIASASSALMHVIEAEAQSIEVLEDIHINEDNAIGAGLSPENFRQIVIAGTSDDLLGEQSGGFPETIQKIISYFESNPASADQQISFDIKTREIYIDDDETTWRISLGIEFAPSGIVEYVRGLNLKAWSVSWVAPCIKYQSVSQALSGDHDDYWRIVKRAGDAKIYIECMFDGTRDLSEANDYKVVSEYWNGFTPKFARQNFSFYL